MYELDYTLKEIAKRLQVNVTRQKEKKMTLQAKQLFIDNRERMEVLTVFPVGSSV